MELTVLICTHNRADLLARVLASLHSAARPETWHVKILVVANACSDGTHALLEEEHQKCLNGDALPVDWLAEPRPGKSHALNTAIPRVKNSDIVTFVDDDHRVDKQYLVEICRAAEAYPDATMFCGRILPDWDGSEPAWVHNEGAFRIRPLPIPRSDGGPQPKEITLADRTPGGGNLFLRGHVFDRVGQFSTALGPKGHDLGGGEDSAFVHNALTLGERLFYAPPVIQHHYVDAERFRLRYLLRKAFQRSRTLTSANSNGRPVPWYLWRKLAELVLAALLSFGSTRRRFYVVRVATTLGEILGIRQSARKTRLRRSTRRRDIAYLCTMAGLLASASGIAARNAPSLFLSSVSAILLASVVFTMLLGLKSASSFTQTGPKLQKEILAHFKQDMLMAFARLLAYAFALLCFLASPGVILVSAVHLSLNQAPGLSLLCLSGGISILISIGYQFSHQLLLLPANITASYQYRVSRLYPYWRLLSPSRLRITAGVGLGVAGSLALVAITGSIQQGREPLALALSCIIAFYAALLLWLRNPQSRPSPPSATSPSDRPNILMIGSDTLRADRVDGSYEREVAPFLREMSRHGVLFSDCYVPCARTAPSLISLLTGIWPHRFGVRDNFVTDEETRLPVDTLPSILRRHGYFTAALSDWCGADLRKFSLGFDYLDIPEDQWNIRFLIRQGPKDLRLLLSLFLHNRLGKALLPEIYYLAGIPLTNDLTNESRQLISDLAAVEKPFFLNIFLSTTHGPFGSEYPYYKKFSDPDYNGESKYVMARLTDPFEIIRRQGEPKTEFDLDQIINLYDGCVTRFDDAVRNIAQHLEATGLRDNTILVIYSDHGMEFFEHNTWGQGNSVIGDLSNRIPLLIQSPQSVNSGTIRDPIRSIDLAPTLLSLADIRHPNTMDGVAFTRYLDDPTHKQDTDVFSETGIWLTRLPGTPDDHLHYPDLTELLHVPNKHSGTISIRSEYRDLVVRAKDRMMRRGRWKLVYQPLTQGHLLMLFDMQEDPTCTRDVRVEHPDITIDLWDTLRKWILQDPLCKRRL